MLFWSVCFWKQAFFVYGMRSMWNRTGSRDNRNLEHAFYLWSDRSWRHSACYIRQHKCLLTKSLESEHTVTQQFAYIINQPKQSIRRLWHLHQCCSEISILLYPGSPAASRRSEWEKLGHTDSRCFYLCVFTGNYRKRPISVLFPFAARSMWKTRICRIDLYDTESILPGIQ